MSIRVAFVSVVPSPYQRDLFHALAQRSEVALSVAYLEAAAPDSPWPEKPLAAYERILPGLWLPLGNARCHVNTALPDPRDYDVVVMNTLMSVTAQWLMRARLRSTPWIFWGERLGGRSRFHAQLSAPLHRAAGIAAIGSWAQSDYQARFPEPRSFRIPYYCDLTAFTETPHRPQTDGVVTFLFCGQMIARKGVDLLLEAFSKMDNARLVLVGREAELPALLAPLPESVRARITYEGFQPPEELPRFFAEADVFVLPSRYDGWGVVVNQAIGAGLPIVCSDLVGAAHDLVEDNVNGLRFQAGSADSLEAALRRFVATPEIIEPWGAASRQKAREWSPEVGAGRWVEAFQEILAA